MKCPQITSQRARSPRNAPGLEALEGPGCASCVQPTLEAGAIIRAARTMCGLPQWRLAERLGVSQTAVSQAERGERLVDAAFLRRVLRVCRLPEDWRP